MSENGKYRSGGEKAYPGLRGAAIAMALAMGFSLLPAGETELSAAEEESKIRTYTFAEVTAIAKNNGSEVEQQKANVESAETRKEDQLSSYQTASYEYWYNGGTGDDSSLDSMEESYQSAVNNYKMCIRDRGERQKIAADSWGLSAAGSKRAKIGDIRALRCV